MGFVSVPTIHQVLFWGWGGGAERTGSSGLGYGPSLVFVL